MALMTAVSGDWFAVLDAALSSVREDALMSPFRFAPPSRNIWYVVSESARKTAAAAGTVQRWNE